MIERNLGNVERVLRLLLGTGLLAWLLIQPQLSLTEWFVGAAALMLILNGLFSRCYLWYVLDISTCRRADSNCA